MCKTKMSTQVLQQNPTPRIPRSSQSSRASKPSSSSMSGPSTSSTTTANYTSVTGSSYKDSSATSTTSKSSLSSLRESLPENAHIYDFTEIRSATNNFLAKRFSSSSSPSWRCLIRGKDVIVFQRKLRRSIEQLQLRERLSLICRSHHMSIIKLLGVSISGSHIYLVYDFVNGANLADCLRNAKNPNFTVLSNWISRMQIVSDIAHGLDYIHNSTGLKLNLIHNHIKSNSIIVTEPSFNAKLCHFGTAELCGEIAIENPQNLPSSKSEIIEISEESSSPSTSSTSMKSSNLKKSDSLAKKFEGTRGYMSPEFTSTGIATQKSDVYAFGVVILEILSGEEPLKFRFDKEKKEITKISVIETAREAMEYDDEGIESGRLRRWIDRRLKDSFPVDVAMKLTRIALDCVHGDVDKRPNMRRVVGKISKLYLESTAWMDKMKAPVDFSVSLAPR